MIMMDYSSMEAAYHLESNPLARWSITVVDFVDIQSLATVMIYKD
jgi:hypothetical protein